MRRVIIAGLFVAPAAALVFWWWSPVAALGIVMVSHALVLYPTLRPNAQWLGPVAMTFATTSKELWLTIDDGPAADTKGILDALDARGARATFFVKGMLAAQHPDLIREIVARGHAVGNHSHSHPSGSFWCLPPSRIRAEIAECNGVLEEITGRRLTIASVADTHPSDIRIYQTDNAAVTSAFISPPGPVAVQALRLDPRAVTLEIRRGGDADRHRTAEAVAHHDDTLGAATADCEPGTSTPTKTSWNTTGATRSGNDARAIAATLPRSYEALVRGEVKFRVGRLVYAAFDRDEEIMGFGFPRDEREALVASEPDKFLMLRPSDMRYQWVCVRLDALDADELRELLVDAWRMCVPKKVAAAYEG